MLGRLRERKKPEEVPLSYRLSLLSQVTYPENTKWFSNKVWLECFKILGAHRILHPEEWFLILI
jgi:hypothetical protein